MKTFQVALNWYSKVYTFNTRAVSKKKAIQNVFYRLSKLLKTSPNHVNVYYRDKLNSVHVEEVQ